MEIKLNAAAAASKFPWNSQSKLLETGNILFGTFKYLAGIFIFKQTFMVFTIYNLHAYFYHNFEILPSEFKFFYFAMFPQCL